MCRARSGWTWTFFRGITKQTQSSCGARLIPDSLELRPKTSTINQFNISAQGFRLIPVDDGIRIHPPTQCGTKEAIRCPSDRVGDLLMNQQKPNDKLSIFAFALGPSADATSGSCRRDAARSAPSGRKSPNKAIVADLPERSALTAFKVLLKSCKTAVSVP